MTDIEFAYVATGVERIFTVGLSNLPANGLATSHGKWMVGKLNAKKGKADSQLTLPALVRFIHFDWHNDRIPVYEHPFPETGSKKPKRRREDGDLKWKDLSCLHHPRGRRHFT